MSKRPWFPLYVGDLLADTMNMNTEQFGGYLKILCHYWITEEPMTMNEMVYRQWLSFCGSKIQGITLIFNERFTGMPTSNSTPTVCPATALPFRPFMW